MALVTKTLTGELKNADTFIGLMQVMAEKEDCVSRGKGMQGFSRPPAFASFCHALLVSSPKAYNLLGKHLPLPAEQNLRKFSPYFDGQAGKWYLLGGVGEPIAVDDEVEGVERRIADAVENSELATKCRLWTLQVPMVGVPVFIVAAMPISSTLKAEDLLVSHNQLMNGLLDTSVCVVSYATDGLKTERKVSSQFLEGTNNTETTLIPHPRPGFPAIPIVLYYFGPHFTPVVTIQDVKHAMNTAQNSIYSGTHSMILGNCVVHYLQVLVLSVECHSPLYQRDVCKVDRQDDRAATRLFSSAFLRHIARISSEHSSGIPFNAAPLNIVSCDLPPPSAVLKHSLHGLLVLLYVLGEAFDTFQSRSLDIPECIHMYIYRDKLDHPNYSLCGWLHSTEGAKHTSAEARKAKPDFDFSDFVTMVPKLDIMSSAALSTGNDEADSKARASRYSHTLYSKLGINIAAMSNFPSTSIINRATKTSYEEADALFSCCGIAVTEELFPPPASMTSGAAYMASEDDYTAPPIHDWFREAVSNLGDNDGTWVDPEEMACDFAEEPPRLATQLDTLLKSGDHCWGTTVEIDDQMAVYRAAGIVMTCH
ncbi:hypothetical protein FRC06_002840 [Ceratobasidium sp. 370]|nr:hypothetical protein FRC06_002840 [Ceratobasidium sp. 370]